MKPPLPVGRGARDRGTHPSGIRTCRHTGGCGGIYGPVPPPLSMSGVIINEYRRASVLFGLIRAQRDGTRTGPKPRRSGREEGAPKGASVNRFS